MSYCMTSTGGKLSEVKYQGVLSLQFQAGRLAVQPMYLISIRRCSNFLYCLYFAWLFCVLVLHMFVWWNSPMAAPLQVSTTCWHCEAFTVIRFSFEFISWFCIFESIHLLRLKHSFSLWVLELEMCIRSAIRPPDKKQKAMHAPVYK